MGGGRADYTGDGAAAGGNGTVLYLDCSSGYMPVCVCQNLELHTKKSDSYCT